jgi:hypothetical protein
MKRSKRWDCCSLSLVVFLSAMVTSIARGQPAAKENPGIDLVFLVDVSASMYDDPNTPNPDGNDPQRIRWDAVLLALNLLTSEDRVAVIPFNENAPAKYWDENTKQDYEKICVPGKLYSDNAAGTEKFNLINPRSDEGQTIRAKVRTFIHSEPRALGQENEWNGDNGGTAILLALAKARETLDLAGKTNNQQFIVLLTDGKEDTKRKPAGLEMLATVASKEIYKNEAFRKWISDFSYVSDRSRQLPPKTTIYTIGLGKKGQLDENLLSTIARLTKGHYEYLSDNGKLIDYFLTLIWQLKGCWAKRRDIGASAPGNNEVDLMESILDLGALYHDYSDDPNAGPRNYRADRANPMKLDWKDKDAHPFNNEAPGFPAFEESYICDYFNRMGRDGSEKLVTSWNPSASKRRLRFSKRTLAPLFKIPADTRWHYQPFELMRLRIPMKLTLHFAPTDFELRANLRSSGADRDSPPLNKEPLQLLYRSDAYEKDDVDLSDLPKGGGVSDVYTLAIDATGKKPEQGDHSLRGYTLELPDVDIEVEHVLELTSEPSGLVTFGTDRAVTQNRIVIKPKTQFRVREDLPPVPLAVAYSINPSDGQGKQIQAFANEVPQILLKPSKELKPREEASALEGELTLDVRRDLPIGLYRGGKLTISAANPADTRIKPLEVDYDVAIKPIQLSFDRDPPTVLEYKEGGPVFSKPIQVRDKAGNPNPLADTDQVTITIPQKQNPDLPFRQNADLPFGEDELWLATTNDPTPKRELPIHPGETFRIFFKPQDKLNLGYYNFELGLDVKGRDIKYDPSDGRVELFYKAPKLQVAEQPALFRIQPAIPRELKIPIVLSGDDAVSRKINFQCIDANQNPKDQFEFLFRGRPTSEIMLELPRDFRLTPNKKPEPKPMWLWVTAARDTVLFGEHTLHGQLTAYRTEPVDVDLRVFVDDLELTDLEGNPFGGPLVFYQVGDRPLVRKLRVFARAKETNLNPRALAITDETPFRNVDKNNRPTDVHLKLSGTDPCKHPDGRSGVEISLEVTGLERSFELCSGTVAITCDELKKSLPCKVEIVELLKPQDQAAGTPVRR